MPWKKQFDIDEVLGKAMAALWHRGYAATSMQNLVECTGVNCASLYATYGSKRDDTWPYRCKDGTEELACLSVGNTCSCPEPS